MAGFSKEPLAKLCFITEDISQLSLTCLQETDHLLPVGQIKTSGPAEKRVMSRL